MAVVTLYGSRVMTGLANTTPVSLPNAGLHFGRVRVTVDTVTTNSDDAATSTYTLARIPSHAIILPQSTLYWDDLASSGSPTLDVGLYKTNSSEQSFTDDVDALSNGHDVTSAGSASVLTDHANSGLPAWDYIASVTADPRGLLDVKVSVLDAALTISADITLSLVYAIK